MNNMNKNEVDKILDEEITLDKSVEYDVSFDDELESEYDTAEAKSKSNAGKRVRQAVFVLSSATLAVSLVLIAMSMFSTEAAPDYPLITEHTIPLSDLTELPPVATEEPAVVLEQWREWHERNGDFVGWFNLGGRIDYPVLQYLDFHREGIDDRNRYYIRRDIDGNYFYDGSLYVCRYTPILDRRRPDNTIIYGHNLNSGAKFAHLMQYYTRPGGRDLTAYNNNPTLEFNTVYEDERSTYKIFAAIFTNTSPRHGEFFPFWRQRFFENQGEFFDFVGNIMDRSFFYTEVDLEYGDELMTLSTCYFPFGDESHRFVVFARRVREGESPEVDTSKAFINPSPKYFDYYYRVRGGSWAGRNWDTSLVRGFDEFYANEDS
jgi:sortase B